MAERVKVDIRHVDLHLDGWLFTEGFAVIDGSEPATDADLLSHFGDCVFVFAHTIGQVFGLFGIDGGAGAAGFAEAGDAAGVFGHDTGEPALGDAEGLGDSGLGFAGFNAFKDTGFPAALFFDGFEDKGFERAGGYGLVSTAELAFGSQVLAHLFGQRFGFRLATTLDAICDRDSLLLGFAGSDFSFDIRGEHLASFAVIERHVGNMRNWLRFR